MSTIKANNWVSTSGEQYNTIIQVVNAESTTGYTVTSPNGLYAATPLNVSITTKRASSLVYVTLNCQSYAEGTNAGSNGWNYAIARSINGGVDQFIAGTQGAAGGNAPSDSWMGMGHSSGISNHSWTKTRTVLDNPQVAAGTVLKYTVYFGGWTGAVKAYGLYNSPDYGIKNRIIAMEMTQ